MSIDQNPCEKMYNLVAKALIFVSLFSGPLITQNTAKIPYDIFEELKEKKT
jgi:hypothetical protein